jgi:hypothetical protein
MNHPVAKNTELFRSIFFFWTKSIASFPSATWGRSLDRVAVCTNKYEKKHMGRSRYKTYENQAPHFLTCTVINWLPLFTRQDKNSPCAAQQSGGLT